MPNELPDIKGSLCSKDLQQQSENNFDLAVEERTNITICFIVGFKQINRLDIQLLNKNIFIGYLLSLPNVFSESELIVMLV